MIMQIDVVVEYDVKQWFCAYFLRVGFKNGDAHRVLILTVNNPEGIAKNVVRIQKLDVVVGEYSSL